MKNFYPILVPKRQILMHLLAFFICFNVQPGEYPGYESYVVNTEFFHYHKDFAISLNNYNKEDLKISNKGFAVSTNSGGPILVISSSSNPFSSYTAEILLAEGLNHFNNTDISQLTPALIENYRIIVLGEVPLSSAQVTLLTEWTQQGGLLIAFKPDVDLLPLLGLNPSGGTLEDKYILINTTTGPGKGLVSQTIQYHSAADLYTLNGATTLATLYSGASTSTTYPAVSINNVGINGGKAVAFTYDLAKSIIYTRQGNPLWSGQERDNQPGPIRPNDLFYPDYIDLNKVSIPQADEQQRLLANIITQNSQHPIPRFWYLPRGLKAAVVMTGDDHANGGTKGRFNQYLQLSEDNSAEAVKEWRAIRGSSYIYPNTPITDSEAKNFENQGFEIALHLNTNCENYTPQSLANNLDTQLADLKLKFPSIASPVTNRTHCIAFSDYDTQPKLQAQRGIRIDANYYFWPGSWVQNRPGLFTGSGFPMKFADLNGNTINTYQLVTQMTDESQQSFPYTIDGLLNKALGPEGFYGVFCANMHTDANFSDGSDKIIASAKSRNVPVISAKQLLSWLDGRNGSAFENFVWNGSQLNFSVTAAQSAYNLEVMLPVLSGENMLSSLSSNGAPVSYRTEIIKGINYAFFPAKTGQFLATYDVNILPEVSLTNPIENSEFTAPATINLSATAQDQDGTISRVEFYNGTIKLGEDLTSPYTFSWMNVQAGSYSLTAKAIDNKGGITTSSPVNITVNIVCPCTVFKPGDKPSIGLYDESSAIQLGMKFRSTIDGYVKGVRFYKQQGHTGTNIGQLYTSTGNLLAQVTFNNETISGWQEALFSNPVPVTANTTYIISYHSSNGYYSANTPNFSSAIINGPLKGLANGEDGPNGVYLISNAPAFPTSTYQGANYWVDLLFDTKIGNENNPPVIALTSPSNNATFTAPAMINLSADASDPDGTVSKVEFFNGNTKIGEDLNAGNGWSFVWDNVAAGNYALSAKATDDKGATTTSDVVNINVIASSNSSPAIAITSPENNAVFSSPASITISALGTDSDGSVVKVEFFNGSIKLGEDLIASDGWFYLWENVAAGNYILSAKATNDKGATTISDPVNINVSGESNASPSISITSPENNSTYNSPASIAISAIASDTDGSVSKVEFFNGNNKLGEDLDGNNGWTYTWENVTTGNYAITAMATDDKGATAISSIINIVVESIPSPGVTSFSPESGPVNTLVTIYGQNLYPATKVTFGPSVASIVSNTDTNLQVLVPMVNGKLPSKVKITVSTPGGNITTTDRFTITAGTAPANSPPSVSLTSPINGDSFTEPASISIRATASDADGSISKVSFYNGSSLLGEDLVAPYEYTWNNIPAGTYSLSARAIDDKGAVTNSQSVSISVTNPNNAVPVITINSPTNNAEFIAPASISILSTVTDPDGNIAKVEIFGGTVKLVELLAPPYEYEWSNVSQGDYAITVRAVDDLGAVESSTVNIKVNSASQLIPPSNLTAQWVSNTQVNLTWQDNSSNETGFVLERAAKRDFTGKIDLINLPENTVAYQDQNLNNKKGGGILFYRIKAVNGNASSTYSNVAETTVISLNESLELQKTMEIGSIKNINLNNEIIDDRLLVSPNPTSGISEIQFIVQQKTNYSLTLFSSNGAYISGLGTGTTEPGVIHTAQFDGTRLADGIYIIRLDYSNSYLTFRVVVSK